MLNYIWLGLVVIGILVALGADWHDLSTGRYHNGEEEEVLISATEKLSGPCTVTSSLPSGPQKAVILPSGDPGGFIHIFPDSSAPALWKDRARGPEYLTARLRWITPYSKARILFEPVKFVRLNAVTNDGIIKYAKTAVELAIGLIGIMALWLGIMKIAEQSGLVGKLAAALKPITTKIFPDVPPDHPAMGAMIMNISANMLGLANAATPLGLKAMEELSKLNRKAGTATDAMCTFLVINTSNVQIIPATVIALRAAAGSSNPTEILGPVIVATFIALVVGVSTAKILAKLPVYRKQLAE